ncbi:MAG: sugar ABC transporter permease [Bifidobacteriaceae bacterium]|jgi:ABC-type sugar transport system permease subunit|nr:sugar ABC transporter permease [Bifidobacteriaceae bacterium]
MASRPRKRRKALGGLAPIAFISLGLYTLWVIYPVFASATLSLTDARTNRQTMSFVGLENYTRMFSDPRLGRTFAFTLIVTILVTLVSNVGGVLFAMMLNNQAKNYKVMRTLAFIPQVLSGVVVAFMWRMMFNQNGLINSSALKYGWLDAPINWLGTREMATFCVCVTVAWASTAFCTVVYMAGLQSVPPELMDAARVDGAGPIKRFFNVTWPMLAPATTTCVVLGLIGALKLYDILAVLTSGGPANSTNSLAYYVIAVAFGNGHTGYGAALGILLLVLTAAVSAIATRILRKRETNL